MSHGGTNTHIEVKPDFFNITDGPNKWDLLTAFGNVMAGQTVEFACIKTGTTMRIHLRAEISALEHESGGGQSWNFKGVMEISARNKRVKGYYNTHSRSGHFSIV